jgi:diguanylate cyclase (GGDEF)-like protein
MRGLAIGPRAADALMPMHLWAASSGRIRGVGPALQKLTPGLPMAGESFADLFRLRRPKGAKGPADLAARGPVKVALTLVSSGQPLKGISVPVPGGGVLLNLSLGIGVVAGAGRYGLTARDFAPNDPTVEMLYLVEAQEAVLAESRRLNRRLEEARTDAEARAVRDALTGLGNRRALDAGLGGLTGPGAAPPFGLMHIDLDRFKEVNDTLGHAAGDTVLRHVAHVLREVTRADDLIARVGGDEFVVVVRDCDDIALLEEIAARINARLADPVRFHGRPCRVSASIGLTLSSQYDPPVAAEMLKNADAALYDCKRRGRACHSLWQPGAPDAAIDPPGW